MNLPHLRSVLQPREVEIKGAGTYGFHSPYPRRACRSWLLEDTTWQQCPGCLAPSIGGRGLLKREWGGWGSGSDCSRVEASFGMMKMP